MSQHADYLAEKLRQLPGIRPAPVRDGCSHVYYSQCFKYDKDIVGVPRDSFIKAVGYELYPEERLDDVRITAGYVKPLYLQPIYQKMIAYGKSGCPFKCPMYKGKVDYKKGVCPVAERMHEEVLFQHDLVHPSMKKEDLNDIVRAFEKVYSLRKTIES